MDLDAWITLLQRLDPPDLLVIRDLALGMHERERTGNTEALDTAFRAFWARVKEKQMIKNN